MQNPEIAEDSRNHAHTNAFKDQILVQLAQKLDDKGIAYCCWPSIDKPASPGTNPFLFDILAKHNDIQMLQNIMLMLGLKEIHSSKIESTTDSVQNHLGYQSNMGELIRFRVYSQLRLGGFTANNYRFPKETLILESAIQDGLVKAPSPDFALMLFVISLVLNNTTGISRLKKRAVLSQWEMKELERLKAKTPQTDPITSLQAYLPSAHSSFFDNCLSFLQGNTSLRSRILIGHQLRKHVLIANGCTRFSAQCMGWWHLISDIVMRPNGTAGQKLGTKGAIIAIVGSDGAGKSTAIDSLYDWISDYFWTLSVHLGKPPQSISTFMVNTLLRAGRLFDRIFKKKWFVGPVAETNVPLIVRYLRLLRYVLIARDRQKQYRKARDLADNGALVISDRFPLLQLKLMDGPQGAQMIKFDKQPDRLVEIMLRMEEKYYAPIKLPELLVVLRVDPEIAIQRRSDENIALIKPRAQEVWDTDWQKTTAHVIDANQSKTKIISELKSLVWSLF